MKLSSVEKVLLYSSKLQLSVEEIELLNNSLTQIDNWEELAELLVKRGIAPLLYAKRASLPAYSGTPEDFRLQLESAYSRTLMRGMVLYNPKIRPYSAQGRQRTVSEIPAWLYLRATASGLAHPNNKRDRKLKPSLTVFGGISFSITGLYQKEVWAKEQQKSGVLLCVPMVVGGKGAGESGKG